jgi:hypothetical protein
MQKINNYLRESNRSHERVNLKTSFRLNCDILKDFFFRKSDFCQKISWTHILSGWWNKFEMRQEKKFERDENRMPFHV